MRSHKNQPIQNSFGALKNDDEIKIIYVLVFLASQYSTVASRDNLLIEFLVNGVILCLNRMFYTHSQQVFTFYTEMCTMKRIHS